MKAKPLIGTSALLALVLLYGLNASWLAGPGGAAPTLLAHRGVHQTFLRDGLTMETCTATRILEPSHGFIENTLPSMQAAFEYGADIVELDVHPTVDRQLVVFHDWTLDCRTNGTGVTRQQPLEYLLTLDVGYGYTADGGATFPLRGKGIGAMPTLAQVLDAFPNRRLLIHFKSDDPNDADLVAALLRSRPNERVDRLMVYGGEPPTRRALELVPEMRGFSRSSIKECLVRYELLGWTGIVPDACHRTAILIPMNYANYLWGWPHRLTQRLRDADSEVFVTGAEDGNEGLAGVDSEEGFAALRHDYAGGVWTNRIERIGPLSERTHLNR